MLSGFPCVAQVNVYNMGKWQDSLVRLGRDMFEKKAEPERLEKNFTFVKTLVSALKERHSFLYPFQALKMISITMAPDNRFRIFSWNIPLDDGSFLYYGAIQTKSKNGELQLVPLLDKTFEIKNPENAILQPNNWYGAQYYDIAKLDDAYVLAGWKGQNPTETQKVIEILQFDGTKYNLGKSVFSDDRNATRKVFRFAPDARMYLRFNTARNRLIFDHIVLADSSAQGNYEVYGPDLTYDAYQFKQNMLHYQGNVPFINEKGQSDEGNRAPGQALPGKKSGL